jgi:hypothetical protein
VCGWWGCVWVARRVGYIHVLSNSLVVMWLQFYSFRPLVVASSFAFWKNLFLM